MRKIVTSHVFPPIPDRSHDWCAYYDGEEEAGLYGYGATEAEAIEDFVTNCAPGHHATSLSPADERFLKTLRDNLHLLPQTYPAAAFHDSGLPAWQEIEDMFERFGADKPSTHFRDKLAIILVWARYGVKEAKADQREAELLRHAIADTHYET